MHCLLCLIYILLLLLSLFLVLSVSLTLCAVKSFNVRPFNLSLNNLSLVCVGILTVDCAKEKGRNIEGFCQNLGGLSAKCIYF